MSRPRLLDDLLRDGFPRVSGDEPSHESVTATLIRFSPRERG